MVFQEPQQIELIRVEDGLVELATVTQLTRDLAKAKIDGSWWNLKEVATLDRKKENDNHWKWAKRIGELRSHRWHEALCVQTSDGDIQGAILYRLDTTSFVSPEVGAIYVEGLATAPRNRPWLVDSPKYRGVGEHLLLTAIRHSYELGFKGRTNLLPFDDERTIKFYRKKGFEVVGREDELVQMELGPEGALALLRGEGYDL